MDYYLPIAPFVIFILIIISSFTYLMKFLIRVKIHQKKKFDKSITFINSMLIIAYIPWNLFVILAYSSLYINDDSKFLKEIVNIRESGIAAVFSLNDFVVEGALLSAILCYPVMLSSYYHSNSKKTYKTILIIAHGLVIGFIGAFWYRWF